MPLRPQYALTHQRAGEVEKMDDALGYAALLAKNFVEGFVFVPGNSL